ncbi:hypothetical protein CFN78_21570 [Amycolatopsis antarctica]|uniref:DUF6286 domain-containing protein n=1 Tax=Amycolatopsis antarctica TaxID=1854586 RepID=A0A263D0B3_9PSEU|nr:DUF6286 domain-containing protein [Amycolatopsis antarctica]OZM71067.1 hypothetical protein CFN78_21570 [Amycolatopsis antarctica]
MRVFVRLLSTLLGLAVAAAGGLLAVEVGWHWWRPSDAPLLLPWPQWRDRLAETAWDSTTVMLVAGITAAAGLILLLATVSARKRTVRMTDPATEVSVTTSPRSLARLVGHHVRAADNVSGASVTASAKKVRVRATSRLETENQLRPRLQETVGELLGEVPLAKRPKVSVVVDSPKDRR